MVGQQHGGQLAERAPEGPPQKKKRGSGRVNSGNQGLRDRPATSDSAYEIVEADHNGRVQRESDKLRARSDRAETARVAQAELIERGVGLKASLAEMRESLGRPPTSSELDSNFTVVQLKSLTAAHSQVPTGKNKGEFAAQLSRILSGGSAPLLLMDRAR